MLPKEMGIVLMDLPGYGQSVKSVKNSPGDYAKRAVGADLYAALKQLLPKGQKIVLMGHDRGARTVHHMTVHAPTDGSLQVVGIVLCDIVPTTIQWYPFFLGMGLYQGIFKVRCYCRCGNVSLVLPCCTISYSRDPHPSRFSGILETPLWTLGKRKAWT
jgi:pimeloyl-ACP methyl ester carboxylesterase